MLLSYLLCRCSDIVQKSLRCHVGDTLFSTLQHVFRRLKVRCLSLIYSNCSVEVHSLVPRILTIEAKTCNVIYTGRNASLRVPQRSVSANFELGNICCFIFIYLLSYRYISLDTSTWCNV